MADSVKIINGSIDIDPETDEIVVRGVVDPDSLKLLQVAPYQREVLSSKKVLDLRKALRTGSVPDIELGMRGDRVRNRASEGQGTVFYLQDPTFIVDGLQRVTAGIQIMGEEGSKQPRIGATIRFNTTEASERERFISLNIGQSRLSPNVILRDMAEDHPVARALYNLATKDQSFVLKGKIGWNQSMTRGDLITARTFFMVTGVLHSHVGPGKSNKITELVNGLEQIMETVGRNTFIANIRTFFDLVDECWGIKRVAYRSGAVYIKQPFLAALAMTISDHTDFWKGDRLTVPAHILSKLRTIPIDDPSVTNMAQSQSSASVLILSHVIVNEINKGKRTRHLKPRGWVDLPEIKDEGYDDEGEEG